MKRIAFAVLSALMTASLTLAAPLDGSTWVVRVTPDEAAQKAGEVPFDDTLIFKGGKVTMTECVKAGFAPSTYSVEESEGNLEFTTEQTSAKEGKSTWSGTVEGDFISGTLKWVKADGTVLHYVFDGKRGGNPGE